MRFLPTRVHGMIDYAWGIALLASPFLFGFADGGRAMWVALIFGAGAIAYSLVTDYELGVAPLLPMVAHLGIDALAGGILALTPVLFSIGGPAAWTFGLFGLGALVAALVTELQPEARPARI